jgi:hypothetical protein
MSQVRGGGGIITMYFYFGLKRIFLLNEHALNTEHTFGILANAQIDSEAEAISWRLSLINRKLNSDLLLNG